MKKILLFLILCATGSLPAVETSIANGLVHAGTDGRAVLKVVGADFNGNTPSGLLVQGTFAGGTFQMTSNTAVAQGAPGTTGWPVTVTYTPMMRGGTGDVTALWQTYTAAIYGTWTAGVDAPLMYCFAASQGGAMIRVRDLTRTATTAPTDIYNVGTAIQTSATTQCFGPTTHNMAVQAAGASYVSGTVAVIPVQ